MLLHVSRPAPKIHRMCKTSKGITLLLSTMISNMLCMYTSQPLSIDPHLPMTRKANRGATPMVYHSVTCQSMMGARNRYRSRKRVVSLRFGRWGRDWVRLGTASRGKSSMHPLCANCSAGLAAGGRQVSAIVWLMACASFLDMYSIQLKGINGLVHQRLTFSRPYNDTYPCL